MRKNLVKNGLEFRQKLYIMYIVLTLRHLPGVLTHCMRWTAAAPPATTVAAPRGASTPLPATAPAARTAAPPTGTGAFN